MEISGLEPLTSATGSTTVYWTLLIKSTIEGQQPTIAFPPNTAHNFHCTVLSKEQLLPKAKVVDPRNSWSSEELKLRKNQEQKALLFSTQLFGLKKECPSPTLPAQSEGTANAFHFSNQGMWSVCDPWMLKASLERSRSSYGVEMMGSVHGMTFPSAPFLGLKRVEGR